MIVSTGQFILPESSQSLCHIGQNSPLYSWMCSPFRQEFPMRFTQIILIKLLEWLQQIVDDHWNRVLVFEVILNLFLALKW